MNERMREASILFTALAALLCAVPATAQLPPVQPYGANDFGHKVLSILPPGQKGVFNAAEAAQAATACNPAITCSRNPAAYPAYTIDQLLMYDGLVRVAPNLTEAQLLDFYKDATFGVPAGQVLRQYSPGMRPGLVVLRDTGFNVPRVYGLTRSDVMFGAGYVSAEDRLFFMDVLRHVGRGRMSEFLGPSPGNVAMDRAQYRVAGYSEAELQGMIDHLDEEDPAFGPTIQQDFVDFTAGVNQYLLDAILMPTLLPAEYVALMQAPLPWATTDTVAVASLIGAQLGVGGGGELSNCRFLRELEARYGSGAAARAVFEDFQQDDDPEAPVTTTLAFPYLEPGPVNPAAVACPDPATESSALSGVMMASRPSTVDGPFGPVPAAFPTATSNALLVGASRATSGFPVAVIGPQTGYFAPQVLMELELHGPGIDARGAAFPGISAYVLLGRGRDYSWSATSAGSDQVDIVAAPLCEPGGGTPTLASRHYLYNGNCLPMLQRTDVWVARPTAGGLPEDPPVLPPPPGAPPELPDITNDPLFILGPPDPLTGNVIVTAKVLRTAHGIVQSFGTVNDAPVAYVRQRATFMHEVDGAAAFIRTNNPDLVHSAATYAQAMGELNFTFNWFYVDRYAIGYKLSGDYPIRAAGIDPDLPYFATGEWDWQNWNPATHTADWLPFASIPNEINPSRGYFTSWNNKQAPRWNAADANLAYGALFRSIPLDDRILADPSMTLTDLVNAMEDAGTVDLRGDKVVPVALQLLGPGSTGSADADLGVSLLTAWKAAGAHRRDVDGNGVYDHSAAVALMDRWWEPLLRTVFSDLTNAVIDVTPLGFHDAPGPVGSAFIEGWYGVVHKDLRGVIAGAPVAPWSRLYCGNGVLANCRSAVIASLASAVASLKTQFGADPATWDANEPGDRIQFASGGVVFLPSMDWVNRPTFQQAVEYRLDASDITVSPASAIVRLGKQQQFAATVTGLPSTSVLWSVVEGPASGTINASGRYTAPSVLPANRIAHIRAASAVDASVTDTAVVQIRQNAGSN